MRARGGQQKVHDFWSGRIGIADCFDDDTYLARRSARGLAQVFEQLFDWRDLVEFLFGERGGATLEEEASSVQLGNEIRARDDAKVFIAIFTNAWKQGGHLSGVGRQFSWAVPLAVRRPSLKWSVAVSGGWRSKVARSPTN
jgi:hypothetical protein